MKQQSQAAIGRALGLSPASVSKLKGMGMPIDSVAAARAWRENNIAPTMRGYIKRQPAPPHPTGAVPYALELLDIAAATLNAGHSIDALVPVLRMALHAVPEHERDPDMMLPTEVMDVLVSDVVAVLPPRDALNEDGSPAWRNGDNMGDEEAAYMGRFWYEVAAGEIAPTEPGRVPG